MQTLNHSIATCFFLIWAFSAPGQQQAEYKIHLRSIDSTYYPGHIIDRNDTVFNANRAFVDYAMAHLLQKPADMQYISNRALLPKLKQTNCDSSKTKICGYLPTGECVDIVIQTGRFDAAKHTIARHASTSNYGDAIKTIDGKHPFGVSGLLPERGIQVFSIKINGKNLVIPKDTWQDLFEPCICTDLDFERKIEAYSSLDGQFIYVYIYGGNAAGTYFAKLVFNKEKYLTKIVAEYYDLSTHGSFRSNFIGY